MSRIKKDFISRVLYTVQNLWNPTRNRVERIIEVQGKSMTIECPYEELILREKWIGVRTGPEL